MVTCYVEVIGSQLALMDMIDLVSSHRAHPTVNVGLGLRSVAHLRLGTGVVPADERRQFPHQL